MIALIEGIVGALLISLIPLTIAYVDYRIEQERERRRDHTRRVILDRVETHIFEKLR